jgi:hypothetical protein
LTDDQVWERDCAKATCSADLDGDGIDEIVVLYAPADNAVTAKASELDARVYKNGALTGSGVVSGLTLGNEDYLKEGGWNTSINSSHATEYLYDRIAVCRADLDGDGKDELLLYAGKTAWALKLSATGSCAVLESNTYTEDITDIAAGDCDGDGKAEFAVCLATQGFALYDSSFSAPLTSPELVSLSSSQKGCEACFGDFDGDNVKELCVNCSEAGQHTAIIYKLASGSLSKKQAVTVSSLPSNIYVFRAFPRAIDINGDGTDELFYMYKVGASGICVKTMVRIVL